MTTEGATKKRYFLRRGALAKNSRSVRIAATVVLAVTCAALTFTQLGFTTIILPDQQVAYAIVLLLPVALSSLLLGTFTGTCMGLFAGSVLYVHSIAMPLDFFELTFINPLTSIVMLGVSGLVMGLLFSFALRHNPSPLKCVIYISLICLGVSWLYSFVFSMSFISVVRTVVLDDMSKGVPIEEVRSFLQGQSSTQSMRLGNIGVQIAVDAILMALFCIIGELGSRHATRAAETMGMRATFAAWLSVVALVAFMITSGVSFAIITNGEIDRATEDMESELAYISDQLANADNRMDTVFEIFEQTKIDGAEISDETAAAFARSFSYDTLFDGYIAQDDGTYMALSPSSDFEEVEIDEEELLEDPIDETFSAGSCYIALCDDARFEPGQIFADIVDDDIIQAVDKSVQENRLQRVVLDTVVEPSAGSSTSGANHIVQSEIAYVLAQKANGFLLVALQPASKVFENRTTTMGFTSLSVFILLATVFIVVFLLINRVIVRRINETNGVLARITAGDLDAQVDVRKPQEFASLSDGVNNTVEALKGWIAEAETRMDAELATAKEIQESALPRVFPPFPDITDFDIYATMNAAKEVGGDFYDFFLIEDAETDSSKLAFLMADVSGKGVPAALFMMKAKTQLRDYLKTGIEIGEAVENANRQLCEENDAAMFVTVFAAVLDYETGEMVYVNAGHNPPLLRHEGEWTWLTNKSGLFLGAYPTLTYKSYHMSLEPGDELLLYTDGVTEAWDREEECYGEERLVELVKTCRKTHPRKLVEMVRHDVAAYAQGAEQSDDITILALEFGVPPEATETLMVPASVDKLPQVIEFIHEELDQRLCPMRVQKQLDLAVEELFVNIAHYAYPNATPDTPGEARVSCTYSAEPPSVVVEISDDGLPYNPLDKPDAVMHDNVEDMPIGGLGIFIIKQSVDEMTYERIDGSNVVTLVKKW